MKEKEKLVLILGPTAVGKTSISVQVAANIGGEIISADSMQVYRGMNIGTAKIKKEEMISPGGKEVPHHLIDVVDPDENFSVADFQLLARKIVSEINIRGKIPLMVGGTGLYLQAVIDPYHFEEMETDWEYREEKKHEAAELGYEHLHTQLKKIDPAAANRIHPNDTRRIIWALEVFHRTGKTMTELSKKRGADQAQYELVMVGLYMEREALYRRIDHRVDQMIKEGLIDEVENLLHRGYDHKLKSMQGLGYRQIAAYLTGILSKEEAINLLKRDTRRYAKRQLTWFRRDQRIKWFDVTRYQENFLCAAEITLYVGRTLGIFVE